VASFSVDNAGRLTQDANGKIDMIHGFGGYGVTLTSVIGAGVADRILDQRAGRQVSPDNPFVLFSQVAQTDLPTQDGTKRNAVKKEIAGDTAKEYTVREPSAVRATARNAAAATTRGVPTGQMAPPPGAAAIPPAAQQTITFAGPIEQQRFEAHVTAHRHMEAAGQTHYTTSEFERVLPHWMSTNFSHIDIRPDGVRLSYPNGAEVRTSRKGIKFKKYDADKIRAGLDQIKATAGNNVELTGGNRSYKNLATAVARARGMNVTNYKPLPGDELSIAAMVPQLTAQFALADTASGAQGRAQTVAMRRPPVLRANGPT